MLAGDGRATRIPKLALLTAAGLGLAYLGWGMLAAWLLVRPRHRRDYDCVPQIRYGRLEPLTLFTSDGLRLHAWVLLARKASPDDWVLLLHGYRSDRTVVQNRARFFSRRGYNVLLLHFRGHGSSERARISYGFYERLDVKAAFDFIRSLRPGRDVRIGINGISMGAAAAAYAVGQGDIDPVWMVLESCYDNIRHALANRIARRVGEWATPIFAWPVEQIVEQIMRLRAEDLDPAKALEKARCPVLVLAGDSERVLKLMEIEYLYGCLPEPKRLELFPGAGHNDLLAHDPKRFARAVRSFLRDYAPRPAEQPSEPPILEGVPAAEKLAEAKAEKLAESEPQKSPSDAGADIALPLDVKLGT
jgi:pimeloyl-ACP methyl ester carboxylesterase